MRLVSEMRSKRFKISALLAVFVSFLVGSPAFADVKPGDMITPDNAAKVKDLVSPGVFYKVGRGMSMKIVPTQRIDWPPPVQGRDRKVFVTGPAH